MCTSALSRVVRLFVLQVVVLSLIALVWPAEAEAAWYGWFDYNCNGTNTNGTLKWRYTWDDNPPVYEVSRRAGSGIYLNDNTNGWLPQGWYSITAHYDNYNLGTQIFGRVWRLSDKVNPHNVVRYGLFIHTEETPSNGQSNPTPYDDPQAWEGDFDYKSLGCVKLSYPYDIDFMHYRWNNVGGTTVHGSGYPYPMSSRLYAYTW